jgi:hypothetical protein
MLGNDEAFTFADGSGLLLAADAVDDNQDLFGPNGGIAAKILVIDAHGKKALADHGAQAIGDVNGSTLDAVIAVDNEEIAAVMLAAVMLASVMLASVIVGTRMVLTGMVFATGATIIPILAGDGKKARFDGTALPDIELAFFVSAVFSENAESLVSSDGGVAAHGLIVDSDAAIHTTPSHQVAKYAGDVSAYGLESVVSPLNEPDVVLSADTSGEESDSRRY